MAGSASRSTPPAVTSPARKLSSMSGRARPTRPAGHRLEVELTETALVDSGLVSHHLAEVRNLGASVAIDDFGTGYTSVAQSPHLPVDILKIDPNLRRLTDPRQRELVNLMIGAAHAFELRVVAEGIEDRDTLHTLAPRLRRRAGLPHRPTDASRTGDGLADATTSPQPALPLTRRARSTSGRVHRKGRARTAPAPVRVHVSVVRALAWRRQTGHSRVGFRER